MRDLIASAWLTVTRHRLRSLLAIVGVAVGVCALISIMSVENSWRRAVVRFFSDMDLQTVQVSGPDYNWRRLGYRRADLEAEDARAIAQQCRAVEAATFVTTWPSLLIEHEGYGLEAPVRAVEVNFCEALPDTAREGRLFTTAEESSRAPVCILSYKTRLFLFGDEPAVGQSLRLGGYRFQVIGVILGKGHLGIGDDGGVYVPSSWARILRSKSRWQAAYRTIFVHTRDPRAAAAQIDQVLRDRIGGGPSARFTDSLWQVREAALHSRSRATFYSGLAALCALLAAGVGIAALLFVSVSERARDIGVMRALGASRLWIYGEQIAAALFLAAGGAVAGALLGIPSSAAGVFASRWQPLLPQETELLGHRLAQFPKMAELAVTVSWQAVAASFALAVLTGVLAALAPASEAAQVDPAHAIAQRPGSRGRLREVLTCLQVGFGVLVLVVLTSYFSVLQNEERVETRRRLGDDRLIAAADPIAARREPIEDRELQAYQESLADVLASPQKLAALRAQAPLVTDVTPVVPLVFDLSCQGRNVAAAELVFTGEDFLKRGRELIAGDRAQIEEGFTKGAPIAVINGQLREEVFGERDPVGRTLRVGSRTFTIVGAREGWDLHSQGGGAWVPISFYGELKSHARHDMMAQFATRMQPTQVETRPRDERQYAAAMAQLRDALLPMLPRRYRDGIMLNEQVPATLREFIAQNKAVALRGAIGALAVLLVALIGLANMLLVSVHEELREVGVRRALGAVRLEIFWHFLSQGVALSALGAGAGLGLGALVCWATRTWSGTPLLVSAFWAGAGAVATLLAGTLTSIAPALIGASVQPVEALRYE